MNEPRYIPIDCGLHSEVEVAVLRQQPLVLRWQDASGAAHRARMLPVDVLTRNGAEYLLVEDHHGKRRELRLDRIQFPIASR